METFETLYPVVGGAVATGASVAAGLWLTARYQSLSGGFQRTILAASSGFLLSAVLVEIIPHFLEAWETIPGGRHRAMLLALVGYVAMMFFERFLAPGSHVENRCASAPPDGSLTFSEARLPAILGALTLHGFFDGVSIASGFLLNPKLGWVICVALLLHKIPDGMTVASLALASGKSHRVVRVIVVVIGMGTLFGALSILAVKSVAPYVLPIAAGATLHVAASDLIPELMHGRKDLRTPLAIVLGVLLFYVTHVFLDMALGGETHAH